MWSLHPAEGVPPASASRATRYTPNTFMRRDSDRGLLPGSAEFPDERPVHVRFERKEISRFDPERFDRVAFALRAVRLLKPAGMTVAVYEGNFAVRVESGRDLRGGPAATWGMIAVPPHASRGEIALAVARLAGRADEPFVMDLIMGWPSAS
ncbi:MAG TPA: hypothetical protein PLI95_01060 [Polyangiaceae bacterium]|nr:hypothetical protein [Polyangiaceae bacterium]